MEAARLPIECVKAVVRPVARFCLRHSIKLQELIEICKSAFIQAASEELLRRGGDMSVSRISVMTGVHRPDVMRLTRSEAPLKTSPNLISRVIGQWQHDSRFRTKSGKPRTLTCEGLGSEFVQLIRSVSGDLNPYTVLFELERIAAVERTRHGLRLKARMYISKGDAQQGFDLLSHDMNDLVLCVEENVLARDTTPNLHIKTEYDNIVPEALTEIRAWLVKEGATFQRRVREYLAAFDRDVNSSLEGKGASIRVCLGTFSRVEHLNDTSTKR